MWKINMASLATIREPLCIPVLAFAAHFPVDDVLRLVERKISSRDFGLAKLGV